MLVHKVLLAAAAAVTLAAPAAALADTRHGDDYGGYRGDVHRTYDQRDGRYTFQDHRSYGAYDRYGYDSQDYRDGWRARHHHHHHDDRRFEDRWRR